MKRSITLTILAIISIAFIKTSLADVIVLPAQNQTNTQMEADKHSCYGWAKGETGFDPMKAPTTKTASPPQTKKSGGILAGGVGGALLGGIVGGSSGAKKGAAAGGLVGGVSQSSANKTSTQNTENWKQQEANNYANNRNKYNRAYSACLEGKGYTVK